MIFAQETMTGEIIVDNFAGGGGASTGIEIATGMAVAIAINHDPAAILMHKTNHPYTEHFQASVWDIDPVAVCRGRRVGLAWFSPDCKHFSKAKGAALVDRKIRGLAWITLRWAAKVRPRVHDMDAPFPTVVGTGKENLCKPLLAPVTVTNTSNSVGGTVGEPVHTVTTAGNQMLVTPFLAECNHSGGGHVAPVTDAHKTITAKHTGGIVAPALIQYHTEQTEHVRASGLGTPINTVDASNRYGLTCANLVEYYTGGRPLDVQDPMHTVTSHDREAVVAAHIAKYYGGVVGEKVGEPLPTVTAIDHNAVCAAHVVKFKGDNVGTPPSEPLQTVTASAGKERACSGGTFAVCRAHLAKIRSGDDLGHWPEIRALLNEFCGYTLAEDEVLLLEISGALYYIADIGLRMLSPRELYNAMGFPQDYIIDRDYLGNEYKKSAQVARCGNAVCPPVASALVRANLPEWCDVTITTMAQLMDCVAV